MVKLLPMIGLATALALIPTNSNAQLKNNNIRKITNKELSYNFKQEEIKIDEDSLNHQYIISKKIYDIFKEYWEKEWLLLINKHLMIEMNKLRKSEWISELVGIDEDLRIAAQKQAEFLNKEWRIYHMKWENILRKRLQKDGIIFITSWENLALWQETIQEVIEDRLASKWHKINILTERYKKMWLGIKNKTRVLNWIG